MVTKKVLSYLLSRTLGPNAALKHIFHHCSACYATTSDHPFSQSQLQTSTKVVLPSFPCQQWKTRRGFEMCVTILNNNASVCSGIVSPPVSWHLSRNYSTKKDKKSKVVKGGKKKVELTPEELDGVLALPKLKKEMQSAVEDFTRQIIEQVSIRTNIGVYDSLQIRTPDGVFPLIQLGQIVQKNPNLILVNMASSPQYIQAVKEAIAQSGLNVNPQQDGTTIFIPIPKVTREHRESLARNAKMLHDKAKEKLRDISNKYVKKVKSAKEHHSEDIIKSAQDMVLDEMHQFGEELDKILHAKQEELLGGKN
ncbi:ribosome-recycling factor, mitochondrial-like isoform X2 [Pomacea canaliculata]|nr:ribosome-recycling factor, mitochondrial-like isoform X2 [Pomacea canaliculata]